MALDEHIVWRVGEHQLCPLVTEELRIGLRIAGIGAQHPVRAEQPEIAEPGNGASLRLRRRLLQLVAGVEAGDQLVDLGGGEAHHFEVERQLERGKVLQLERQQLLVPIGQLGQAVVGDPVGAQLLCGQVVDADRRHLLHAEVFGCREPAVTGDHLAPWIDQDRLDEAEQGDAGW